MEMCILAKKNKICAFDCLHLRLIQLKMLLLCYYYYYYYYYYYFYYAEYCTFGCEYVCGSISSVVFV